jgi:hypothetical protein
MEKLQQTLQRLQIPKPKNPEVRINPFTGVGWELCPEAVQLYDFITVKRYTCGIDYTRQVWDEARYYFADKWPEEYMDLID